MSEQPRVLVGGVSEPDTQEAIAQLLHQLRAERSQLTLVFFSPVHEAEVVARSLDRICGARGVAGTTAGELWGAGFQQQTMAGISFHGAGVRATVSVIGQLRHLSLVPLSHLPQTMARRIGRRPTELSRARHLWLTLFDGLSQAEELVVPFFFQAAGNASLVGGSLADGVDFKEVSLVHHGRVYNEAAAMILLEYPFGFVPFRSTHMEFSEQWTTVTRMGSTARVVQELDGEPAAQVLARLTGAKEEALLEAVLDRYALGYRFRGRPYPCSILRVLDDGSLLMGNSLQRDERVNVLRSGDLVATTRDAVAGGARRLDTPVQGTLFFHCLGRHLEAENRGQSAALFQALDQGPTCGLNTYGEQFGSSHLNHFVTGVHFG